MLFKDFASKLNPLLAKGESTATFTRTLFETIIPEENYDLLDSRSEDTFKAYYNGQTQITKLAKEIAPDVDAEEFVEYIDDQSDKTRHELSKIFSDVLPGINAQNTGKMIANLFVQIIIEAAGKTRAVTQKSDLANEKDCDTATEGKECGTMKQDKGEQKESGEIKTDRKEGKFRYTQFAHTIASFGDIVINGTGSEVTLNLNDLVQQTK